MRNQIISFMGLAFTVGAAVTVQPLLANNQNSPIPLAANSVNSRELPQTTTVNRSMPSPASEPLAGGETSVPVEPPQAEITVSEESQQTAFNQQQSAVHIEVSLSRRQVTVYNDTTEVATYPIAIGRAGHETPTGTFEIQQMRQNPTWIHPLTDERVKGGTPGNPLGTRWIGFWTDGRDWIGFHGTPDPDLVGQAVSHGCLRMYNEDVEELFEKVALGTLVTVVD